METRDIMRLSPEETETVFAAAIVDGKIQLLDPFEARDHSSRTTLRFFFPVFAIVWGTVMSFTGNSVYKSSPEIYKLMEIFPQSLWGNISLMIGLYCLITDLLKLRAARLVGAIFHCAFLTVVALLFSQHSILGAAIYVVLATFKSLHTFELTYRLRQGSA